MSDYYLFRKYGVRTLSQKRTLSRKNYFKVMTSSRMYKIFVILAILMTSSSDDVIKFSIFEFCNSFTIIVWSYCENIKCLWTCFWRLPKIGIFENLKNSIFHKNYCGRLKFYYDISFIAKWTKIQQFFLYLLIWAQNE